MPQHRFTDNGYEILAGWDRVLDYYYLVVEADNDGDEPTYSNLLDPLAGTGLKDTEYLRSVLLRYASQVPENYWRDIELDRTTYLSTSDVNQ